MARISVRWLACSVLGMKLTLWQPDRLCSGHVGHLPAPESLCAADPQGGGQDARSQEKVTSECFLDLAWLGRRSLTEFAWRPHRGVVAPEPASLYPRPRLRREASPVGRGLGRGRVGEEETRAKAPGVSVARPHPLPASPCRQGEGPHCASPPHSFLTPPHSPLAPPPIPPSHT